MGITVSELLKLDYFKDYHVVAGHKGLHKEIQGVTVFEAPDSAPWSVGKELIVHSGFVLSKEPDCMKEYLEGGKNLSCAAIMVKRGRYLDEIPQDILALHDRSEVPLITMPYKVSWIELMNKINTAVMNRAIKSFQIHLGDHVGLFDQTYKEQKIRKILDAVEFEMSFPAFIYDVVEERAYHSSRQFERLQQQFGLEQTDFWQPRQDFTKHTLCDNIDMVRYRLVNREQNEEPRVSWITIPIRVNRILQAYFVVMEAKEFIDFFDEFAIRIAYLTFQNIYEQRYYLRTIGNIGFENFIHYCLHYGSDNKNALYYQANMQRIEPHRKHICLMFRQENADRSARDYRKDFAESLDQVSRYHKAHLAFLEENKGMIFLEQSGEKDAEQLTPKQWASAFKEYLEGKLPQLRLVWAVTDDPVSLLDIKEVFHKYHKILAMGQRIRPTESIWSYEELGPLIWLDIPQEELDKLLAKYRRLLEDERNREIFKTLRIYLQNNMNFSITAELLHAHINTIRKRIERASELLREDWESYPDRLKTALLLQYLDL